MEHGLRAMSVRGEGYSTTWLLCTLHVGLFTDGVSQQALVSVCQACDILGEPLRERLHQEKEQVVRAWSKSQWIDAESTEAIAS